MGGQSTVEIYSAPADADDDALRWTLHACATIRHAETLKAAAPASPDVQEIIQQPIEVRSRQRFYQTIGERGLQYGPSFQVLGTLHRMHDRCVTEVEAPEAVTAEYDKHLLHPALLDGLFQALAGVMPLERDGADSPYTYMPVSIRRLRVLAPLTQTMRIYARRTDPVENIPSPDQAEADLLLLDASGAVLVEVLGVRVQRRPRLALPDPMAGAVPCGRERWRPCRERPPWRSAA
jgi:acyl transferase domain-containing protein